MNQPSHAERRIRYMLYALPNVTHLSLWSVSSNMGQLKILNSVAAIIWMKNLGKWRCIDLWLWAASFIGQCWLKLGPMDFFMMQNFKKNTVHIIYNITQLNNMVNFIRYIVQRKVNFTWSSVQHLSQFTQCYKIQTSELVSPFSYSTIQTTSTCSMGHLYGVHHYQKNTKQKEYENNKKIVAFVPIFNSR